MKKYMLKPIVRIQEKLERLVSLSLTAALVFDLSTLLVIPENIIFYLFCEPDFHQTYH